MTLLSKVVYPAQGAVQASPEIASAWTAGVESTQSWWRHKLIAVATSLAGGERGFAACRRAGKCEREPQRTLELLIESASMWECRAESAGEPTYFPASQMLVVLAELAKTPDFQAIVLKRVELSKLLRGVRDMQTQARHACSTIERLGKLNYTDLRQGDIGPAITDLCTVRVALEELLK